ncbi:MAG: cation:proton antiporter, partial [Candidatus Methylomirabilis sp.]|nr:cation:proton antiporter [Deltaproteobacteria bacterium]
MHDTYGDVLVIFGLCAAALYLCNVLRVPTIVGLLVIGVAAGPKGLGFVQAPEAVSTVSELGVILLLFTIGIEFSIRDMLRIRKLALLGGALQVGFT